MKPPPFDVNNTEDHPLTNAQSTPTTGNKKGGGDGLSSKHSITHRKAHSSLPNYNNTLLKEVVKHSIARDFMNGKVAWYGLQTKHYFIFLRNHHFFISLFACHKNHHFTTFYRLIVLPFILALLMLPYEDLEDAVKGTERLTYRPPFLCFFLWRAGGWGYL